MAWEIIVIPADVGRDSYEAYSLDDCPEEDRAYPALGPTIFLDPNWKGGTGENGT